ncbi:MAG: hypothetical protein C4320_02715 [Armatimonadota bacterium]
MTSLSLRVLGLGLCSLLAVPALAWNAEGHKQVADIAWTRLRPVTKTAIMKILAEADPAFAGDLEDERKSRNAFRLLSVMPDTVKGSTTNAYAPLAVAYNNTWIPKPDPSDREQILCKTWHYYDEPIRYTGPKPIVRESNALNALVKAQFSLAELYKKNDNGIYASWWLGWIEHIVGDLHQPLHCTSNYSVDKVNGDAGGNKIKLGLQGRNGRPLALHAYWDNGIDHAREKDGMGGRGKTNFEITSERWSTDRAIQPASARILDLQPLDWIHEGAVLADKFVYSAEMKDGYVPDEAYESRHREICKQQALLAGYRLAEVLNRIFDPRGK